MDEEIVAKIHQAFRIKYLKDSVLMGALDELTTSTINTLVFYNNFEIITSLQKDRDFIVRL